MAKGTRDATLVVRAKNEASKSLDAISSALDALTKSQEKAGSSANQTGSLLNQLGSELSKLSSQINSTTGMDKISNGMAKATDAVSRMEQGLTKLGEQAVQLDADIAKAEGAVAGFASQADRLRGILNEQKVAVASAKGEFQKLGNEVKSAEADLAKGKSTSQGYVDQIGKLEAQLAKTAQKHRELATAILVAAEPSAKLLSNFEKTDTKLREQEATLRSTRSAYVEYQGRIKNVSAALPELKSALSAIESSFNQAASAQKETAATLKGVESSGKEAARNLASLRDAAAANAEALTRQQGALTQAKNDLYELSQAADIAKKKSGELNTAIFRKVADDAANLNKAAEYVRWWTKALEEADRAEGRVGNVDIARSANGYRQVASEAARMGSASRDSANALGEWEAKGRSAMSWTERFRGELVALTLSFVGVYSAIEQMRNAMRTVMEMDAATTRMGVAFDNNQAKIATEMAWVQSEADRLGISVKTLAAEYSKLSIATKGTALEGEQTRTIFKSLAEAFRVNNLSQNQMELSFNAISQMVNKATVSMEELRQQLGERLYGAFNLAANSMGYTTAEFSKLVGEGKVATEDFLPKLAKQLDKTFGPGLAAALQNVSADVGKFQNAIVQAQIEFGKGGFTEGLQLALYELTKQFKSEEGQSFFRKLGAAAGQALVFLAKIPQYSDEIVKVFSVLIGIKAYHWFTELGKSVSATIARYQAFVTGTNAATAATTVNTTATTTNALSTARAAAINNAYLASVGRLPATMAAATSQTALLTSAMGTLTRAATVARGVMAALGGLPGIIVTGLSVAASMWLTKTEEVNTSVEDHLLQMGKVQDAYLEAAKNGGKWVDSLKGLTTVDIRANLDQLLAKFADEQDKALRGIASRLGGLVSLKRGDYGNIGKDIAELIEVAQRGGISMAEFRKQISKLAEIKGVNPDIVDAAKAFSKVTSEAATTEKAIAEAIKVLQDAGVEVPKVSGAILALAADIKNVGDASSDGAKKVDTFGENLTKLKSKIPSFKEEMDLAEALKEIQALFDAAAAGLDKTSAKYKELLNVRGQAVAAATSKATGSFVDKVTAVESGGNPTAKNPNSTATGLGQFIESTWLSMFRKYFPETAANMGRDAILALRNDAEVSKKLVAAYAQENAQILNDAGVAVNDAALYMAHFLGPKGAVKVLQAAAETPIKQLLSADQIKANPAVLGGNKTAGDVTGWAAAKMGVSPEELAVRKQLYDLSVKEAEVAKKKTEDGKKYNDDLRESLLLKKDELAAEGAENLLPPKADFVKLYVQEEINKAKKAGKDIEQSNLELAAQVAEKLWEQKKLKEDQTRQAKAQQEVEQRISMLQESRQALQQSMQLALERGDTVTYTALKTQLVGVNDQLEIAIDDAIRFWESVGGPKAQSSILALQAVRDGLKKVDEGAIVTANSINTLFSDGVKAWGNSFLDKIRETGNVFESLRESFQQFLSDFLLGISKMIMQQAIFNALKAAGMQEGGGVGGIIMGALKGMKFHSGGVVGAGGTSTAVSPAWYTNAVRYHSGGIAGLKPNEVPAVLQNGEEVLTANDPRHVANGGGGSPQNIKIINTIDSGSMVSEGLSTADGERALFNFVRANKASLKQVLA